MADSPFQTHAKSRAAAVYVARAGLFTAIAVVAGYLLIAVPNVELVSAIVALSGLLFGAVTGLSVGILTYFVYGLLNAFGPSYPYLWAAQMMGMGLFGLIFGLLSTFLKKQTSWRFPLMMSIPGALLTIFYDLITNLAFPISVRMPFEGWLGVLVAGIPFALIHLASNFMIFFSLVPILFKKLQNMVR